MTTAEIIDQGTITTMLKLSEDAPIMQPRWDMIPRVPYQPTQVVIVTSPGQCSKVTVTGLADGLIGKRWKVTDFYLVHASERSQFPDWLRDAILAASPSLLRVPIDAHDWPRQCKE